MFKIGIEKRLNFFYLLDKLGDYFIGFSFGTAWFLYLYYYKSINDKLSSARKELVEKRKIMTKEEFKDLKQATFEQSSEDLKSMLKAALLSSQKVDLLEDSMPKI